MKKWQEMRDTLQTHIETVLVENNIDGIPNVAQAVDRIVQVAVEEFKEFAKVHTDDKDEFIKDLFKYVNKLLDGKFNEWGK